MCTEDEHEGYQKITAVLTTDLNDMVEELHRLRERNAELQRDVRQLHDALADIIHGRKMYPRRSA